MIGASLLNTITESLYDDPIVVFREYVQNSIDSFKSINTDKKEVLRINICTDENILFIDNGIGIDSKEFDAKMTDLGNSDKKKEFNIGYKGIGRLSGLPYCNSLVFVNILSYKEKKIQIFTLDGKLYKEKNGSGELNGLEYENALDAICEKDYNPLTGKAAIFFEKIKKYEDMFDIQDTGFCVILESPSSVLKSTIKKENFMQELSWLLPVKFDESIYSCAEKGAFEELESNDSEESIPAEYHKIIYNGEPLTRPFNSSDLRAHTCLRDFEYAVGVYTFNDTKIDIEKNNPFSGIKVYLDNMLLCDENELITALERFNVLDTTSINEMIVSVRGIGALIYITDKSMISANARRNFIEVSDDFALELLEKLAIFVKEVYLARYALSRYQSAMKKNEQNDQKIQALEEKANNALVNLARQESVRVLSNNSTKPFEQLSLTEKKAIVRKKVSQYCNSEIKKYIDQLSDPKENSAIDSFKMWLKTRVNFGE